MFFEQQISILEWFLKDHVTLKTGVMTAENSVLSSPEKNYNYFMLLLINNDLWLSSKKLLNENIYEMNISVNISLSFCTKTPHYYGRCHTTDWLLITTVYDLSIFSKGLNVTQDHRKSFCLRTQDSKRWQTVEFVWGKSRVHVHISRPSEQL